MVLTLVLRHAATIDRHAILRRIASVEMRVSGWGQSQPSLCNKISPLPLSEAPLVYHVTVSWFGTIELFDNFFKGPHSRF